MIKDLERLLKTREVRELAAAGKVQECKDTLSASRDQRRRRERNIKDYQSWLINQESKLFNGLKNAPVGISSLEEFRMKTAKLKEKEVSLFNRVQKAKTSVKNSRRALAEARSEYFEITKAKEKLKEFITIQKKKAAADRNYKEESEAEFDAILKANMRNSLILK